MDLTSLGLKKPLATEGYDVNDFNFNADKINELIEADREQINSLDVEVNAKASKAWSNLITATLQNGWAGNLGYRKNDMNMVNIIATLAPGTFTSGTLIANLPVGYRPLRQITIPVWDTSRAKAIPEGFVIDPQGNIYIFNPASSEIIASSTIAVQMLF